MGLCHRPTSRAVRRADDSVAVNVAFRAQSDSFAAARDEYDHELGHRLQAGVARNGEDEHEVLFLWLYDTWVALWGREFADAQVLIERARRGPYPKAWDAALALDSAGRATRFRALRNR